MTIIWILLSISLLIYELITMNIILIFYFGGIILSLLVCRLTPIPNNYILEIVLAVLFGSILLYLFRDKLRKYLTDKDILLSDKFINKEYKIDKNFKNNKGYVNINNKKYKAVSKDKIKKKDKIIVEKIVHNKLVVKKKD